MLLAPVCFVVDTLLVIGQVYGIVEFKDGVRRVDPVSIKFCDEENATLCALVKHNEALRKGEANVED